MASSSDVKLNEVDFTGDEEEEEAIFHMKAKLHRFDKWVNELFDIGRGLYGRGNGIVKLLKHRGTGKFRLVFMNANTLLIHLNFDDNKEFMEAVERINESLRMKKSTKM